MRTLVLPNLSCCDLVYGSMDAASKNKLQLCLNNLARFVFTKRKYDAISEDAYKILNCSLDGHSKKTKSAVYA